MRAGLASAARRNWDQPANSRVRAQKWYRACEIAPQAELDGCAHRPTLFFFWLKMV
jgi:hypothetical protein